MSPTTVAAIRFVMTNQFSELQALSDEQLKMSDNLGRTVVHAAAYMGNLQILEYLINERKMSVHDKDNGECTATHYARGFVWEGFAEEFGDV